MRIGDVIVDPPLILAPMAGVTGRAFRRLCRRHGAGMVCSEMISANALVRSSPRTRAMLLSSDDERPLSIQLFGAEPVLMAEAARMVEPIADIIDINMGCGVPKVIKGGAGAVLMADPNRAEAIIRAVRASVSRPVTVKMRRGYQPDDFAAVELARRAERAGAAAVTIHPRAAGTQYREAADWTIICEVKRTVGIPVIGNGDVRGPDDLGRMLDTTGCDAVMIGRAALGNPLVFDRLARFLRTGELAPEVSPAQRLRLAIEHGRTLVADLGESVGVRKMRTQIAWYAKGFPHATEVRAAANGVDTWQEMETLLRWTIDRLAAEGLGEEVAAVAAQNSSEQGND